jgi:adenylylsulfate kinase-like enzyme
MADTDEPPVKPDLHLHTERETSDASRDRIIEWLESNSLIARR